MRCHDSYQRVIGSFLISPNKISSTHRAAYKSVFGEISQNVCVLHKCDNPPCCRPSHLFLGTKETNNKDRNNKGRTAFGDRSGRTKLKEGEVVEILKISKFYPQCKIRKAYKIPKGTIHAIISRKSWKYITLAAR